MKKRQKFSFKQRLKSFTYAFSGLKDLFAEEHNAWIHAFFAIAAIALGFVFGITPMEWCMVLFAIALVFSLELINSSVENLSDFASPQKNDFIRKAKDMAAAAVLVSAIASFIIGIIIFLPYILDWLG
ncbi:diacylglycerol kinase [Dysgonomonas sp. PH5-45]|uniref:diacylglycerol kinase family protein n=1 Tax=unclassified Dysgonomonas TaxID=2630389 RepID=UPI0024762C22|nr:MULTISPECIES: diacylglycerol kinase family protein [unclassified Dysgonomonas]MDH6356118.1 diacylglycerol kinase [Dysgonomonas sp. PH5-45]MDH6389009.1 diacylglycerol kinase [Dysgonomonas sp. PH5-37]